MARTAAAGFWSLGRTGARTLQRGAGAPSLLKAGLILIDVQAYWQQVVKGLILLLAVFWDELRRTRRDED